MSVFDQFRAALRGKATSADIEQALASARKAHGDAEAELHRLRGERADILLADDGTRNAHRSKIRTAEDRVADATEYVEALITRLEATKAEEAEAGRRKMREEAEAATKAGAAALAQSRKLAKAMLVEIGKLSDAERAVSRSNQDLPTGVDRLPQIEEFALAAPGRSEDRISDQVVAAWVFSDSGHRLSDEQLHRVVDQGEGRGYLRSEAWGGSNPTLVRRRFRVTRMKRSCGPGQVSFPAEALGDALRSYIREPDLRDHRQVEEIWTRLDDELAA